MYIDKLIRKEVITLIISVAMLVIIFIGVTFAKFLSIGKGQDNVISMGDLKISFCNDSTCDSTYSNIGQVIGTKVVDGVSTPVSIYPYKSDGSVFNETPYIFKIENTGTLDSTVKIRLKEDATFTPSGDYADYARLTSKYADHLKVAIRKIILYEDTGYQIGDVDMNGIVNKKDANLILDSLPTFTDLQRRLADFNRDGTINTSDSSDIYDMVYNRGTSNAFEKIYTYTFSELEDGVIWKNEIIKSGDSVAYSLWLYLDDTTPNDAQNTFFVGNIDVDGEFIPKVNPVSFSTDSWETIATAVRDGNISKYNVGDTKEIDMGTYGTHTLRIANTSTPSECSTEGFSQSACGFVLEFTDVITNHVMNSDSTNVDGWPASSMYTFVNNDIYNALPTDLKGIIINTTVVSGHGKTSGEANLSSTDKLYLLSTAEIWAQGSSNKINYDTARDVTRQLDFYANNGVTTSNYNNVIKKNNNNVAEWWLRTSNSGSNLNFYGVGSAGAYSINDASYSSGVSPAFRIG